MKKNLKTQTKTESTKPFLRDIGELRRVARMHIEEGAVVDSYQGDKKTILKLLNAALATELVCVLRYKRHYYMAEGIYAQPVKDEFLEHATAEQGHADRIAERITQLGGEPDFNPETLHHRSHSEYVEGESLVEMVKEDLVAERIAIESYTDIVHYIGDKDPTTRRLMEEILAVEEEHADDMSNILAVLDPVKEEKDKKKSA